MFLHIDIDSFFASAERAVNPDLEGRPIAVGGRSNLEIFNRERTHIKLMNENSGAFVTPVFYSDREKCFDSFFVDRIDNRRKIRQEYQIFSDEAYRQGRIAFLQTMVTREPIFHHPIFYQRYEAQAKANLKRELYNYTHE